MCLSQLSSNACYFENTNVQADKTLIYLCLNTNRLNTIICSGIV